MPTRAVHFTTYITIILNHHFDITMHDLEFIPQKSSEKNFNCKSYFP